MMSARVPSLLAQEFFAPEVEWWHLSPIFALVGGALFLLVVGALTPTWPRNLYAAVTVVSESMLRKRSLVRLGPSSPSSPSNAENPGVGGLLEPVRPVSPSTMATSPLPRAGRQALQHPQHWKWCWRRCSCGWRVQRRSRTQVTPSLQTKRTNAKGREG